MEELSEWRNAIAHQDFTASMVRAGRPNLALAQAQALRRLEGLHGRDQVRWYDLMRIVLTWALWRRADSERTRLLAAAQISQENIARKEEVQTMAQTIAEALIAEGEARGATKGRLQEARWSLQRQLTKRFGALPAMVVQRIEATEDLERLRACTDHVDEMQTLDALDL